MSQHKLLPNEVRFVKEAIAEDYKDANIRLREGEYQYSLVKVIASFQLDLCFPDVKDIIKRLYGEEKAEDLQFVRKIQTILKKMEKSNIVRIMPKRKPWELQRYALSSFKFQDSDKNLVNLATDQEIYRTQDLLRSIMSQQDAVRMSYVKLLALALMVVSSYSAILWTLIQPVVNPIVFIPAFSVSILCALMLGKTLSRE
jgi:hypothetical protein